MDNNSNVIHKNNKTTKKSQAFAPEDLCFNFYNRPKKDYQQKKPFAIKVHPYVWS
jgi:hypothetical protein